MSTKLRIVAAQINFMIGDVQKNMNAIITAAHYAEKNLKAEVVVFPELTLIGYPAEDLLLRCELPSMIEAALNEICATVKNIYLIFGYPHHENGIIHNALAVTYGGKIITRYFKRCLPNYNFFDEKRYFTEGSQVGIVNIKNIPLGLLICEDLWCKEVVQECATVGAKMIVCANASPYRYDKAMYREQMLRQRIADYKIPFIYTNWYGAQDEIVFDGGSLAMDSQGNICQHAGYYQEKLLTIDAEFNQQAVSIKAQSCPASLSIEQSIYQALVTGIKDYVLKNAAKGVVIGLSGGIDSALALTLAVDALGNDRVEAVMMPSRHTSTMSLEDAKTIADNLQVTYKTISIEPMYEIFIKTLKDDFKHDATDLVLQNLQARIRTVILMAISNETGKLVLTTSNKSELAAGYGTLYGDLSGAFAVLKDVLKTQVYQLAEYRNKISPVIPARVITRAPTAELAPNQTDQQSLPPYDILDKIITLYVEHNHSAEEIVNLGFSPLTVNDVITKIYRNEYKRRQAPPGVRISHRSFGRDRRYPITHGFYPIIKLQGHSHEKN